MSDSYWQIVYQTERRHWTAEVWLDRETFRASHKNPSLRPLATCHHAHRSDLAAISCAARMRRELELSDDMDAAEHAAMRRIEDSWA